MSGQCDVLEYRRGAAGIPLAGKAGLWQPYPVEYKRGRPREDTGDALQLCAQAMCLESMLCCGIPEGALCAPRSPSAQRLQRGSRLIFRGNRRIPVLFQAAAAPSSRKTAENSMFLTKIHRSNCASLLSLPPRGAWIEMPPPWRSRPSSTSLPPRGAWIEISTKTIMSGSRTTSLPPRGAWIEIGSSASACRFQSVAPPTGSVD